MQKYDQVNPHHFFTGTEILTWCTLINRHLFGENPTLSPRTALAGTLSSPWAMDTTPTLQAPSGPMTRARARAIKTKVSSLLSDFHFDALGTWLLPQTKTLCMLTYQGNSHGEAKDQGQALTEAKHEEEQVGQIMHMPGRPNSFPNDPDSCSDDPATRPRGTRRPSPNPDHPGTCLNHSEDVRTSSNVQTSGLPSVVTTLPDNPGSYLDHPIDARIFRVPTRIVRPCLRAIRPKWLCNPLLPLYLILDYK